MVNEKKTHVDIETEKMKKEKYLGTEHNSTTDIKTEKMQKEKYLGTENGSMGFDEKETIIEDVPQYTKDWQQSTIIEHYRTNADIERRKNIIQEIIFQRLTIALSIINIDDLQVYVENYTKSRKKFKDITLYSFLVDSEAISKQVVNNLIKLCHPESGESLIPGYSITKSIGEGGMGAVFRAKRKSDNADVAIKIFAPPVSDVATEISRFKRECELALQLNHPYIIQSHECGDFYGLYYLIMEYVDGQTLADYVEEKGKLEIEEALTLFQQVFEGMWEAWNKNYIHRDIKPANILLTKDGTVKLCDFGLAKALDSDEKITKTGAIMGTPQYMSPEQFRIEQADYRSDAYSLGITLYVMLTGNLPFSGGSYIEISQAHLLDIPDHPLRHNVDLPKYLVAFIFKLMAKNPSDRCENREQLQENFQRLLKSKEPKGGVSYFITYKKRNLNKRLKVYIAATIVICVFGYSLFIIWENQKQQEIAEREKQKIKENQLKLEKEREDQKIAEQKFREEQKKLEQQRLEQEKKLEQQRLEQEKKLEQQRLEQEKKLAEERKKNQENLKKQKMLVSIESIKEGFITLNPSFIKKQFINFREEYPEAPETKKLKSTISRLFSAVSQTKKHQFKAALAEWKKIEDLLSPKEVSQLITKLFTEEKSNRISFLLMWFRLDQETQEGITTVLKNENSLEWLKKPFLKMSNNDATICTKHISKIDKSYAKQLQVIRTIRLSLKNIQKTHSQLDKRLQTDIYRQNYCEAFSLLIDDEKVHFINTIPTFFSNISMESRSIILNCLLEENNERYHQVSIQKLRDLPSKNVAPLLIIILREHQNSNVKKFSAEVLYQHKNYSYLQKIFAEEQEEIQKIVLNLITAKQNPDHEILLLKALDSQFTKIREASIENLVFYETKNVIDKLKETIFNDKYISLKKKAINVLGKQKNPLTLETLIDIFDSNENFSVGKVLIDNIGQKGTKKSISFLLKTILEDRQYRRHSLEQLIQLDSSIIIEQVEQKIPSSSPSDSRMLIGILQDIGKDAIPSLGNLVTNSSQFHIKKSICKALGEIGNAQGIKILQELLEDHRAKKYAIKALKTIKAKLKHDDNNRKIITEILKKAE